MLFAKASRSLARRVENSIRGTEQQHDAAPHRNPEALEQADINDQCNTADSHEQSKVKNRRTASLSRLPGTTKGFQWERPRIHLAVNGILGRTETYVRPKGPQWVDFGPHL
jgi:hypothetical protein